MSVRLVIRSALMTAALVTAAACAVPAGPGTDGEPLGASSAATAIPPTSVHTVTAPASTSSSDPTDQPRTGSDGPDSAPAGMTVDGVSYRRGQPVPWFGAVTDGHSLAVTTGPKIRGACDKTFYRLTLAVHADSATVTSYSYTPEDLDETGGCPAIGLPPAVATIGWVDGDAAGSTLIDGVTGRSHPIRHLLLPTAVPAGMTRDPLYKDWPQVVDPTRPAPFWEGASWTGPGGTLSPDFYQTSAQVRLSGSRRALPRGRRAVVRRR